MKADEYMPVVMSLCDTVHPEMQSSPSVCIGTAHLHYSLRTMQAGEDKYRRNIVTPNAMLPQTKCQNAFTS